MDTSVWVPGRFRTVLLTFRVDFLTPISPMYVIPHRLATRFVTKVILESVQLTTNVRLFRGCLTHYYIVCTFTVHGETVETWWGLQCPGSGLLLPARTAQSKPKQNLSGGSKEGTKRGSQLLVTCLSVPPVGPFKRKPSAKFTEQRTRCTDNSYCSLSINECMVVLEAIVSQFLVC